MKIGLRRGKGDVNPWRRALSFGSKYLMVVVFEYYVKLPSLSLHFCATFSPINSICYSIGVGPFVMGEQHAFSF